MKPIARTDAFLKALSLRVSQSKNQEPYDQSLSIEGTASGSSSKHCLHRSSNYEQSDNCSFTAGDIYLLEQEKTIQPIKHDLVVKRGKLVDLGIRSGYSPVALVVTVIPKADKIGVIIHLLPTGKDLILPPHVTIALLSSTSKVLQAVSAEEQNDCIQLKPFKGKPGVRFAVEISLNGVEVREEFQL